MTQTLQLEEPAPVPVVDEGPKLLVEWSSRWDEFVTSIKPALSRSHGRLAGETPYGLVPYRLMPGIWLLEAFLLFVAIVIPTKIAQLRPYVAPAPASHDVIYYSGDELPQTEDLGGSEAGASGRSGGNETRNRTQTIRVARGGSLVPKVVDTPNLKLPASTDAVANLLAINPIIGPPPSEGLRSSRSSPRLNPSVVAPAPRIVREYTRNGVTIQTVIPPAPSVAENARLSAPALNTSVIAPAPSVTNDHTLVAPRLDSSVIAPAPRVSDDRRLVAPRLDSSIIAPAPRLNQEGNRSAPGFNSNVIAPAPSNVNDTFSHSSVQMATNIIPPPVSAPERESIRNPKLTLPAASVVAPPPSANVSDDLHRVNASAPSMTRTVVPPPPSQPAGGSFMSSLIGKIFGPSEVVPPPPSAPSPPTRGRESSLGVNVVPPPPSVAAGRANHGSSTPLSANVVPPPPNVGATANPSNSREGRNNYRSGLSQNVVPPPPSSGTGESARSFQGLTNNAVVAPPPSAGSGEGVGHRSPASGGTLLTENVVPPPPSIARGGNLTGSGSGSRGSGLGGSLNSSAALAPPAGGSGNGTGIVVSSKPGSKVGDPGASAGSLAMSPAGGDNPGLSGTGGGTGIERGNGPGSGMTAEGTGAGRNGAGHGSDPSARGGISPTTGSGGVGNGTTGVPPVAGVSINGGSAIVTLPSFGSDGGDPSLPGRSSIHSRQGPEITIVATSRSGGAFNFYGKLPGDNYTVYLDTTMGTVVMQFADPVSATHSYPETLAAPQAVRTDLPAGLPHARMVVQCVVDRAGNLSNFRVLEPGPAAMTAKIMAVLPGWKFRPAMRRNQPVSVNAILGFGIDTSDRY